MLKAKKDKKERILEVVELVKKSDIASLKNVTTGILKVINDGDASVVELKKIIELDPPLTARVLKTANSAYYNSQKHIGDITEAVIWLGFDVLIELALSQKVCEVFKKNTVVGEYSREKLWKHSAAVAILAKMIYRMEFGEKGDNIYAAGLLHDLGFIIFDQFFKYEFKVLLKSVSRCQNIPIYKTENEIFGLNHSDIGRIICESWLFPEELSDSVGYHHNIDKCPPEHARMASVLFIANYLCNKAGFDSIHYVYDQKAYLKQLDFLGLEDYSVELIVEDMKKEMIKMEEQGIL